MHLLIAAFARGVHAGGVGFDHAGTGSEIECASHDFGRAVEVMQRAGAMEGQRRLLGDNLQHVRGRKRCRQHQDEQEVA